MAKKPKRPGNGAVGNPKRHDGLSFRVGTDIGGTFTDVWVSASDGRHKIVKTPSTKDQITGVIDGLKLAAAGLDMPFADFCAGIEHFGHGSTVGINALLTGRAAKTAVLTTRGFKDTLEIGRIKRTYAGLSELEVTDQYLRGKWPPVVPRDLVIEVAERIDSLGNVVQPLDMAAVRKALADPALKSVTGFAICTLWSTANGEHELQLRDIVRKAKPDAFIAVSHELCPVVGEYGRMSTTAVNAALGPVMSRYLSQMEDKLRTLGVTAPILVMTSGGGVITASSAAALPVSALFSGPAAGVMASVEIARQTGRKNALSIDAGGTSFDAGLIVDGKPLMQAEIGIAGAIIYYPSIDVGTIGAGGGSIAEVRHGALNVGPQSAGADPGPACYGRGGTVPTTTDANLLLGTLDPDNFLEGRMKLHADKAEKAINEHVAKPLGYSTLEAAWGIRRIFESKMADLLRRLTIERGHDPRDFVVIAGGGSGPAHAAAVCKEVGIAEFIVPATATAASAFGTGISDIKRSTRRAVSMLCPSSAELTSQQMSDLKSILAAADKEVRDALVEEAFTFEDTRIELIVGLRYRGQTHQLDIGIPDAKPTAAKWADCVARFEKEYESLFGKGAGYREAGFEVTYVGATGTGVLPDLEPAKARDKFVKKGVRAVVFDDPKKPVKTPIYEIEFPASGQKLAGPCIVEYPGHTVVMPPKSQARTDKYGNLHVRIGA